LGGSGFSILQLTLVVFISDKVDDVAGVGVLFEDSSRGRDATDGGAIDVTEGCEEDVGILVVGDGLPPTGQSLAQVVELGKMGSDVFVFAAFLVIQFPLQIEPGPPPCAVERLFQLVPDVFHGRALFDLRKNGIGERAYDLVFDDRLFTLPATGCVVHGFIVGI